ncbi:DUF2550 domain-containing protein [Rhodococcus sp. D2-41]|uniref:DUF2550 domain-containing protein n=1 Tax=Speluncibacter jeojiensis TaxID=2710754 RepID=A0A9X4M2V7_9ACTN|nr:DUF2550 domain-containing protein [Rhodococcus sp. D2-41]MDG3012847.1 DUF2550 domain-containing protein [Rhodococcus sp. D2-41]MDG3017038.1 DUF2550 domain-containing protein [Corynebacteriales bacterium D3-21]
MIVLIILIVLLVAWLVAAFGYRFAVLRKEGTSAIVRALPAADGIGWRHGVIRYSENTLWFYRLTSVRIGPDRHIQRQGIEVIGRRGPKDSEYDIMTDEISILEVRDGDRRYEFAFDLGALTAFLSWVESRPSVRSKRRRPRLER